MPLKTLQSRLRAVRPKARPARIKALVVEIYADNSNCADQTVRKHSLVSTVDVIMWHKLVLLCNGLYTQSYRSKV